LTAFPNGEIIVDNIELLITLSITLFSSLINCTKLFYTHIFTIILIKTWDIFSIFKNVVVVYLSVYEIELRFLFTQKNVVPYFKCSQTVKMHKDTLKRYQRNMNKLNVYLCEVSWNVRVVLMCSNVNCDDQYNCRCSQMLLWNWYTDSFVGLCFLTCDEWFRPQKWWILYWYAEGDIFQLTEFQVQDNPWNRVTNAQMDSSTDAADGERQVCVSVAS
jgi:hypothetical protein